MNLCLFALTMSPCALCVESLKGGQTLQASSIGLQIVQTICKQCILIVHNLYNSTHNQNKLQVGKYSTACYLTEITFVQCKLIQTFSPSQYYPLISSFVFSLQLFSVSYSNCSSLTLFFYSYIYLPDSLTLSPPPLTSSCCHRGPATVGGPS